MDKTTYDFVGSVRGAAFSRRHVSSVSDMNAKARDFSDLSNPDVMKNVCLEKVEAWKQGNVLAKDISVDQILAGLTNQLFAVSIPASLGVHPEKVLFRIYGTTVGDLYDTGFELTVFKLLSKHRAAPQLIGEFEGGRIEQYLDGPPLVAEDMANPSIVTAMANILARFHGVHLSVDEMQDWPRDKPVIWQNLKRWAEKARKLAAIAEHELRSTGEKPAGNASPPTTANTSPGSRPVRASSITSTEELLTNKAFLMSLAEKKSLLDSLYDTGIYSMTDEYETVKRICLDPSFDMSHPLLTVAFCHNDVQENNILCTGSRLRLIDFEYSNFNYPAFDIANFFCEMTMVYTVDEPPCFKHASSPADFPSESLIRLFGSVYMSAVTGESYLPEDERLEEFVRIIHRFALASHLLWGFWSIIRAPQAATNTDFDYLMYAKSRFDAYKQWKAHLGF